MKRFKKIAALLLAAAMMLTLLTACGGGNGAGGSAAEEQKLAQILDSMGFAEQKGNQLRADAASMLQNIGAGGKITGPEMTDPQLVWDANNHAAFLVKIIPTANGKAAALPKQVMEGFSEQEFSALNSWVQQIKSGLAGSKLKILQYGVAAKKMGEQTYWAVAVKVSSTLA